MTRSPRALAMFAAVALLVVSCGATNLAKRPAGTPRANDRLAALIAGAREERELQLSWTAGYLDQPEELARYQDEFNREYGLNVRATFLPLPGSQDSTAKLLQDVTAGRPAFTDVYLGTEAAVNTVARGGALVGEPWSYWAPNISTLKLVAPGGVAVEVQSRTPGITYNSQKLVGADVPRSMADLLKRSLKGRVATTSDAATLDRLASPDIWGADRALDYVRKLGPQLGGFMDCGDEARIIAGDYDVFAFDCGSARVAQLKANGALLGWSVPADAAFLRYLYMGVPKTAAHPNAARLWINFMLGRPAQDVMYQYEYADHYLLPGSRSFTEIDRATKAGVKFYEITVEAVQSEEARGFKSLSEKMQTILRDTSAPPKR